MQPIRPTRSKRAIASRPRRASRPKVSAPSRARPRRPIRITRATPAPVPQRNTTLAVLAIAVVALLVSFHYAKVRLGNPPLAAKATAAPQAEF